MAFDAFVSYSHAADDKLAPALQRGLQQLAKPWSRRQALRIFRDDTGLSVNPALWNSITNALDESEYFILLASPGAAASPWVNQEVTYWMASRPDAADRLLPVVTDGAWVWDEVAGDIDWAVSTAAPAALAGVFAGEPRHLDMVWARSRDDLDLHNTRFRDAVADLAAPIHGIPKDELESEDVRQHRKALRLRRGAVAALLLLVVSLGVAGLLALRAADTARAALRDLEDANGDIDDLTTEGELLAAANREAETDLAVTEAARLDAEALAAAARDDAAEAMEAREQADASRARAEEAQAVAEEGQAAAEAERVEAEAARTAAEEAQSAAEQGRDAAEVAAAEAAAAEADARRQEAQARAGENAALDAQAEAVAASEVAKAAETQARADEQAAREAGAEARLQEAEARRAEAVAQAGERLAQAAEADALAAEQAAVAAEALARGAEADALAAAEAAVAAEALARALEQEARDAEAAAVGAAAAAEQRRQDAEAATLAASLARAATIQSDPTRNALLAVESYCAIGSCATADQPHGLRAPSATVTSLRQTDVYEPERLDPFVAMLDSVARHQDLLGSEPGWTGHAVDVAVSGDGDTVAALREDGTVRVWHRGAPDGVELDVSSVVGVAVSDDGTTVAVVTSTRQAPVVAVTHIELIDVPSGRAASVVLDVDFRGNLSGPARLSFRPGSRDIVLVQFDDTTMLFDPALEPSPQQPPGAVYRIGNLLAAWVGDDRLVFVAAGEAFVARPDGSERHDITNVHTALPTVAASIGATVAIGYADGSLGIVRGAAAEPSMLTVRSVHPAPVHDVAVSPDGGVVVSSADDGSVNRFSTVTGAVVEMTAGSRRPVPLAAAAGPADVLIMAVEDRVERRTASLSWAAAFARHGVTGPPTAAGALLIATPTGHELSSPEQSLSLADVELPAVVSADGSTLLMAGTRPRVAAVASISNASVLDVLPELSITRLALSPTGTIAAVLTGTLGGQRVVTFDGRTGAVRETIEIRQQQARCCPNVGRLLVSDEAIVFTVSESTVLGGLRTRIEIHPHGGAPPRTIVGGGAIWLTSGPDAVLYVAGTDGVITDYPVAGGEPSEALDVGSADRVTAIGTELSGGHLIAVGYQSGRVELWNLQTDAFITELSRHSATVTNAAIGQSNAGLRVNTTAGDEGVVRTLDNPDLLRGALCALAGRDLSEAEWRRFVGVGTPQPCARGLS